MNFIYEALKKAEEEGKRQRSWISQSEQPAPPNEPPRLVIPEIIVREFSMLRQRVQQAQAEQGMQVIAITSSISGEGCSTVAYFLSLLLSQSANGYLPHQELSAGNAAAARVAPRGVLLIDGNLERPLQHRLFDVELHPGLAEFALDNRASNLCTRNLLPHQFDLVTSGNANGYCHDIWHLAKMKTLFQKLREQFAFIIIDAPPVLHHPETLSLSRLADGVLLVVKANQTRLEVIDEAKLQLKTAGARLLGVVLNERRFFIPQGIYKRI